MNPKRNILRLTTGLLLTNCLSGTGTFALQAKTQLTAKIDSVSIVQGSKTPVHLTLLPDSKQGKMIPEIKEREPVGHGAEIASVSIDTINLDNGRTKYEYTLDIQAFDPGNIVIGPFGYVDGTDTTFSNPLPLKVLEVDLDTLTTINPMAGVEEIPSRWYDWIPDWLLWGVCGLLGLAAIGILLWILLRKKRVITIGKPARVIPPYELALSRLDNLKAKDYITSGNVKLYYTELTDILRQYLEGRFGVNALEMTSTEILRALNRLPETKPGSPLVQEVLSVADFVKFAKVRPLPDDNVKAFNNALKFIEDTKPVPVPEPAQTAGSTTTAKPAQPKDNK